MREAKLVPELTPEGFTLEESLEIDKRMAEIEAEHIAIWGEIVPFADGLPDVEPFNLELLPESVRQFAQETAEIMDHAPIDFAAVTVMVQAATLVGRKVGIKPKQFADWEVIPNLWSFCCGDPSVKKTPIQKAILKPLMGFEADERKKHEQAMVEYAADTKFEKLQGEEDEKKARGLIKKGDHDAAKELLRAGEADKSDEPTCKRYVMHDATVEKTADLLGDNPQGILQLRDELSGFFRSIDREDKAQDRAFYLEAFNGTNSTSYDRILRGSRFIPHCVVSLIGNIQPGKFAPYIQSKKSGGGDDGLVERMQLGVYPDKPTPKRVDRTADRKAYDTAIVTFEALRDIPLEDETVWLRFDAAAQIVFNDWYDQLLLENDSNEPWFQAHKAKYASLMPSLALLYHLMDGGLGYLVTERAAMVGAAWCQYLETHARRLYAMAYAPHIAAKLLLTNLRLLPDPFSITDLANKKWAGLSTADGRKEALDELVTRCYLTPQEVNTSGRRKTVYHKNPSIPVEGEL
jgi:hypothetical protein